MSTVGFNVNGQLPGTFVMWHSFTAVQRSEGEDFVTPMISAFYHGTAPRRGGSSKSHNSKAITTEYRFDKNVYYIPPVMLIGGVSLVVSDEIFARLKALCEVDAVEAHVDRAYLFPFSPGSLLYEVDEAMVLADFGDDSKAIDEPFINHYRVHQETPRLWRILLPSASEVVPSARSVTRLVESGIWPADVISLTIPSGPIDCDMYLSGRVVCSDRIMNVLFPYLIKPYFLVSSMSAI